MTQLHYHLDFSSPETHRVAVTLRAPATGEVTTLWIPVWTPGSYLVREFSRFIGELAVADLAGNRLNTRRTDKGTWLVDTAGVEQIVVEYDAWCHELTVRTPHIDHTHGFVTGSNVLVAVEGLTAEPARLTVARPAEWQTFVSLQPDGDGWLAADYDELADTPVEVGPHRVLTFDVLGVRHRIILWGHEQVRVDAERLADDFAAIVTANASIFGGLPYARYDFIVHITAEGRGGLEHLSSTVLATPWKYFDTDAGYREFLGLVAHEHFHVWNVKRIRPRGLFPFNYHAENYTRALWVSEGFTSYFDDLVCMRAKRWEPKHFIESLRERIEKLSQTPGRLRQTVEDASFDAWIRLYRPDEDSPHRTVSYYLKGAMVALCLDLSIRGATHGTHSLDDVMRGLWASFVASGQPFDEDAIADVVAATTGVQLHDELRRWTQTTDELPLADLLRSHGMTLHPIDGVTPDTGLELGNSGTDVVVRHVRPRSPGESAQLSPGDTLVAIDGRRVTSDSKAALLDRIRADEAVQLYYFRRQSLRSTVLVPAKPLPKGFTLEPAQATDDMTMQLRQRWLGI